MHRGGGWGGGGGGGGGVGGGVGGGGGGGPFKGKDLPSKGTYDLDQSWLNGEQQAKNMT